VRHRGFDALRQDHRDAVTTLNAGGGQGMAEPVGLGLQLAIGAPRHRPAFKGPLGFLDDGHGIGRLLRPAPAADLGDVEVSRHLPMKLAVQAWVLVAFAKRCVHKATPPASAKVCKPGPVTRQMRQSGITVAPSFS